MTSQDNPLPPSVHIDEPVTIKELLLDSSGIALVLADRSGSEFTLTASLLPVLAPAQELAAGATDLVPVTVTEIPAPQLSPKAGAADASRGMPREAVQLLRRAVSTTRKQATSMLEALDMALAALPDLPKRNHATYLCVCQGYNYQTIPWEPGTCPLPLGTRISDKGRTLNPIEVALLYEQSGPGLPQQQRYKLLSRRLKAPLSLTRRTVEHARSIAASTLASLEERSYSPLEGWGRFLSLVHQGRAPELKIPNSATGSTQAAFDSKLQRNAAGTGRRRRSSALNPSHAEASPIPMSVYGLKQPHEHQIAFLRSVERAATTAQPVRPSKYIPQA